MSGKWIALAGGLIGIGIGVYYLTRRPRAQYYASGYVVDAITSQPVSGCTLTTEEGRTFTSRADGSFKVSCSLSSFNLHLSATGYLPKNINVSGLQINETVSIGAVSLAAIVQRLPLGDGTLGDLDDDGWVTETDLNMIEDAWLGNITLTPEQARRALYPGNTELGMSNLLAWVNYVMYG